MAANWEQDPLSTDILVYINKNCFRKNKLLLFYCKFTFDWCPYSQDKLQGFTNIKSNILWLHAGSLSVWIPPLWPAGEHPQHALVQRRRRHGEPIPQRPVPPAGKESRTNKKKKRYGSIHIQEGGAGGTKRTQLILTPFQAFSDYQIQQMTANFVDQFGFNDEEFSEHDENIK